MTEDFDYTQLDPGIQDIVRQLHAWGFETTDSGDGVTKFQVPEPERMDGILDFPHVVVIFPEFEKDPVYGVTRMNILQRFVHSVFGLNWVCELSWVPGSHAVAFVSKGLA